LAYLNKEKGAMEIFDLNDIHVYPFEERNKKIKIYNKGE